VRNSSIELLIPARPAALELDGPTVGRVLPYVRRRMVGPFILRPHVMLIGGNPIGKRHIWWNFVSSSKERIETAKRDWQEGRFAKVAGDEVEYVPLPGFGR
jgi:redox-sensitive bicupin YhaK (pirin superfamily)